jgi:DNA invertase Pin-like site-specific DNA recombinase
MLAVARNRGLAAISLEDQGERIGVYCKERGWQLVETLADDGVSGGRRERLERLLTERVRATRARVIVVYHLDRLVTAES